MFDMCRIATLALVARAAGELPIQLRRRYMEPRADCVTSRHGEIPIRSWWWHCGSCVPSRRGTSADAEIGGQMLDLTDGFRRSMLAERSEASAFRGGSVETPVRCCSGEGKGNKARCAVKRSCRETAWRPYETTKWTFCIFWHFFGISSPLQHCVMRDWLHVGAGCKP